ncbi:alpha/beta hydrolase [Paenibacillus sp. GYB006]|uniref:lipase/acyltransferase domain-containing protein n=1 Tax=Paenibacillus sp. GYB006 TaxID=2994394 RepID=UPI002F9692C8
MIKLLFVAGIKGTELLYEDDNVWFPKNKRDMETLDYKNKLKPGNLLRSVSAFSYLHVNIYKGILDNFQPPMFDFYAYDWRQDIQTQVQGLVEKIIAMASTGDEVVLVAHSMGGMLSKLAILKLQEGGNLIKLKKLITLGTPWHGAPDAYKALAYGEPGIFPKLQQILSFLDDKATRRMARQFPSVYQLMPSKHYFDSKYGKFLSNPNRDKEYIEIALELSQFFQKENQTSVNVWAEFMEPVQKAMLLPLPDGFEHDCLIAHCRPTLYQVPDKALFDKRVFFKGNAVFMNGDGVVPLFSARPTHSANIFYVEGQHHELGSLQSVIDFIKWSINGKATTLPEGIEIEERDELSLPHGFMARVKCPVNPTFFDTDNSYVAGQFDPSIESVSELSQDSRLMYYSIGDSKYLFIPEDASTEIKVKVTSYEKGIADISLQILEEEVTEVKYEPLPVEKGEVAFVTLPTLKGSEASKLIKQNGKEFDFTLHKKESISEDMVIDRPQTPQITIVSKPARDTKKVPYHDVFSGPINVTVNSSDPSLIDAIYYSLNGADPKLYKETLDLDLPTGQHKLEIFGKDIYGRPVKSKEYFFSIDMVAPFTKSNLLATPEGLIVSFSAQTFGTKADTYYRIVTEETANPDIDPSNITEWEFYDPRDEVSQAWGKLATNKTAKLEIQYFSKNPFGPTEEVKRVYFRLGNIPELMWDDTQSYVTPETVWENALKNNLFSITDFNVTLIGKSHEAGTFNEAIADNVKGIIFDSHYLRIQVMYDEKYALFFIGPPTEVLTVGQEYKFSFELLTERSKEKIRNTSPRASLRASRNAFPNKQITLEDVEGTFKGSFIVDDRMKQHKFKLVITDQKNTNPALREIPLTLKEEEG